jgi:hypothetical protein
LYLLQSFCLPSSVAVFFIIILLISPCSQDKNMSRVALADVSDSEDDKLISKEDDSEQEGNEEEEGSDADEEAPKVQIAAAKGKLVLKKKEKVEKKDKSKLDKLFARRSTWLERFVGVVPPVARLLTVSESTCCCAELLILYSQVREAPRQGRGSRCRRRGGVQRRIACEETRRQPCA